MQARRATAVDGAEPFNHGLAHGLLLDLVATATSHNVQFLMVM